MMNRVVLVGRLTRDPELKYTSGGNAVTSFTIATNRPFKNAQGEQEADFINCVIWRKPAESLANYQKKGNLIGVDGRIQTRSYENQEGKRVYVTEVLAESVQFLEPKSNNLSNTQTENKPSNQSSNQGGYEKPAQQNQTQQDPFAGQGKQIDIPDDDLPF